MVSIGVIGCGYWGAKHVRVFHELPGVRLAYAADLDQNRLDHVTAKYRDVKVTRDFIELLESPEVDGVVLATPVKTHYSLAKQALLAGKHVLVEKPLTASVTEAEDLIRIANERGRTLMVGHTFEYNPAVEALADLVQSGELGEILYADAARLNLGLFQRDINVVWDLAPHDLSILLAVLGQEPTSLSARGSAHYHEDIEDVAYIDFNFPSKVLAHVHVSWLDPCKVRRTTIVGTRKMAVYNDVADSEKLRVYDKGITWRHETDDFRDFHLSYRYGNTTIYHLPSAEPLAVECQHFVDCIRDGKTPKTDGVNGLRVVRLLELAEHSIRSQGKIVGYPAESALADLAVPVLDAIPAMSPAMNGHGHEYLGAHA